jgi:hypothetical protein
MPTPARQTIFPCTCSSANNIAMADNKAPTHVAYTKKWLTKKQFVWLEIGKGRQDGDGTFQSFLDRLPIGGFNGYVYFAPIGALPPEPDDVSSEPVRPGPPGEQEA